MSNLGFNGLYGLLNKRIDVVCERAFLPDAEDLPEYIRTNTPIFSIESKTPLDRFHILAFSLSFENDYINILRILQISNIPFYSKQRNKYHPLLIAGGACMFFNPEPVALFFDIIFIGEADESINEFIDIAINTINIEAIPNRLEPRKDLKEKIKEASLKIEGLYIPEFYHIYYDQSGLISKRINIKGAPEKISKRFIKNIDISPLRYSISTPQTEFASMALVELMRGCPWKCRFCVVGYSFNPVRAKKLHEAEAEIKDLKLVHDRIGLIGPSLSNYPGIEKILSIEGVQFSITSLRATYDSLKIIENIKNHKSISLAPEAATDRLRKVINKKITEEEILEISKTILDAGFENLRLYFMIGLPTEKEEDIVAIVNISKKIRSLSEKGTIVLSISTFVPKPHTPFQWHPMEPLESLKGKLKFLKRSLNNNKNIKVFHDLPKHAQLQGILSLGDRRISELLTNAINTENWQKAAVISNTNLSFYLFRQKSYDEIMPWDFIDSGISKKTLWEQYLEALSLT
ncbi:MAG: radical SAM protein [Thermodesulfovibrionales bacterium]|nr:radical SAM protein [Thermodesulfovibrionales bacterium]